jgi:hypothetical protein
MKQVFASMTNFYEPGAAIGHGALALSAAFGKMRALWHT